ncbi:MAG: GHKL domain-containing protein [Candidatus Omnitrophota bacterium]|nr:MAG: GHKL domain-containing protein [Candidatus Omnitrophota bacterium]
MFNQLLNLSNYQYNLHALLVILVSIAIFSIGLFVLLQAKKLLKNVAFFLLCSSLSLWLFSMGFVYLSNNPQTALLWYKSFTFLGVVSIMPSAYLFAAALSGVLQKQRLFVAGAFIVSAAFYILSLTTDKFITQPTLYFWGYYPHYELPTLLFLLCYLIVFITVEINLWNNYRRETIPIKKNQVLIIIVGFMVGFTASADFVAKIWTIPLYPFGFIPIFVFTCLVAYSIIRHKAFDIETAIHRTALWLLTFSFIIVPVFFLYRLLFSSIKESVGLQLVFWITSFFALAFYLRVIQPKIDHFFRRRRYNLEEIAARFTEDLVHLKGFEQLTQRIEDTIADTLYPQKIDIFIHDEDTKNYKLVNKKSKSGRIAELKDKDQFLQWLAKNNKIVYREFVDIDPKYASLREWTKKYFDSTQATVAVPLVLNERLLGIINLSKKVNFRRYTAAEFNFLTTLKNQSTIAISNSLLYENIEKQVRQKTKELVEVQRQLIQAEKLATVGTLAGGVAHEINNPLTAILTNAQMLLISPDKFDIALVKESLELIEEATKRCRTIVQKLMAYAKKPLESGTFTEVNVSDVLKAVIAFIGYQLEQENIKIITDAKEDSYFVIGNQNELEQVLTNIVLNARDAIKRIKKAGSIHISISESEKWVAIDIKDEGIGIPKEIHSKLFDPFFTTKDIGKGLGLGLSICQAIVERHNGTISVQSSPNKGSVFTVKLPKVTEKSKIKTKV